MCSLLCHPSLSGCLTLRFLSLLLSNALVSLFVISGNNHSSSSAATWSCLSFFLFFSFFLYHQLHIIPPPNLVRNRRRPPFFIFDIRWLLVPFSWKPMLLPSQIGAGGKERWRKRRALFSLTFLLYSDSTVRPLGANCWHAREVEMLPT